MHLLRIQKYAVLYGAQYHEQLRFEYLDLGKFKHGIRLNLQEYVFVEKVYLSQRMTFCIIELQFANTIM